VQFSLSGEALRDGGVVLVSEDGRTRFDNSFSARLRRAQDAMRFAAAKVLKQE
jgi:vacuolar-type H+-ATPase subunit E/Vma4